ncbi:MAG: hypothetical protein J6A19_01640 [Oscillospiraceae bacterium]|nr:hypothetical protein [Oscillospiraceae bacterium]
MSIALTSSLFLYNALFKYSSLRNLRSNSLKSGYSLLLKYAELSFVSTVGLYLSIIVSFTEDKDLASSTLLPALMYFTILQSEFFIGSISGTNPHKLSSFSSLIFISSVNRYSCII